MTPLKIVIVDLDGVCFDPIDRLNRCKDAEGNIDWERAFSNEEVAKDPVIEGAVKATRTIAKKYRLLYLTGRATSCFTATYEALEKHNFGEDIILPGKHRPHFLIRMRKLDDIRPDDVIKKEQIEYRRKHGAEFLAAIDDDYNGQLKPMYENLGIPHYYNFNEFFEGH